MHSLPEEIKKFYIEDREAFETRKQLSMECLEDYLKDFDMMILSKECFEKWEKVWKTAESYWIFPEEEDMKKMVNKIYELHKGNNAVESGYPIT